MASPLRILHCLRAPVGGLFRHVLDLAGEQARRGHAVGIVADSNTGDALTDRRLDALAPHLSLGITRVPMARQPGPADLSAYRTVRDLAASFRPEVLHGHGAKGGAFARLTRRSLRRRGHRVTAFYTPHGGSLNYRPGTLESRIFIGIEKILDGLTDGLVFESAYASRVYARLVAGSGAPSRIVPNGLQPADFTPHVPAPDAVDFVFLGELRGVKGIDVLLRALRLVNDRRPARAILFGSGPDAVSLEALARDLDLDGLTSFPGARPAPEALPQGRCFVVPSRAESFPYVVLEAAAAGMPLIATDVGGIPEIVAGTDTPLIPSENAEALRDAMLSFLEDPRSAAERAARLRDVAGAKFTVAAMTTAILDFYGERLAAIS